MSPRSVGFSPLIVAGFVLTILSFAAMAVA